MRTKGLITTVAAVVIAGAYLAGYLPERRVRIAAEARIRAVRSETSRWTWAAAELETSVKSVAVASVRRLASRAIGRRTVNRQFRT